MNDIPTWQWVVAVLLGAPVVTAIEVFVAVLVTKAIELKWPGRW